MRGVHELYSSPTISHADLFEGLRLSEIEEKDSGVGGQLEETRLLFVFPVTGHKGMGARRVDPEIVNCAVLPSKVSGLLQSIRGVPTSFDRVLSATESVRLQIAFVTIDGRYPCVVGSMEAH
jgi:hypothetical protein